jgi:hypothetical protein
MLTLDVVIVLALLRWRPKGREPILAIGPRQTRLRAVAVLVAWLFVGIPAGCAIGVCPDSSLTDAGDILGDGQTVVLRPETWIGKRFPLLRYIEDARTRLRQGERPLRERLAEGDWVVILYRHNCGKCQEKMPEYRELATRAAIDSTSPRVALIEVPPYGDGIALSMLHDGECFFGRLTNENVEWFVETPVEAFIRSGRSSSPREQSL